MTHEPRRDQLLDLALGLLEPDQARALETHAAGCDACRAELAALRQTRALLADLPPVEAPGRGAAVILAAARQAAEAAAATRRPRWAAPRWLWGGTLGLAGAAAVAVLVLRFSGPTAPGPFSDDREALLGQAAPAPAPVPVPVPAPAPAPAPAPQRDALAGPRVAAAEQPAERAKQAVGIRGALGDATSTPPPAPAPAPVAPPPAAMAARAEPAAEAKAEWAADEDRANAARQAEASARARQSEAEASAGARREAPRATKKALASAPAAATASGAATDAERSTCRLEQQRRFRRDDAGQVIGRVREGRYPTADGEVPLTVEERFGPDGRLLGATVLAGGRRLTVNAADVAAGRLEPLPGVVLARTADEAVRAPPRCQP